MKFISSAMAAIAASFFLFWSPMALAGEGHDHGTAAAPLAGALPPKFEAVSEAFELVGVINGKQLTLYLDRYADNSPVNDAQIEIEMGGHKYKAEPHGDGEYEVMLQEPLKPGEMAITATVVAGGVTDLLATELDVHEDAKATRVGLTWKSMVLWAVAGLFALLALGALLRKRAQARRV